MPGEGKGNNLQMASPFEGGGWNNASANNNNTARAYNNQLCKFFAEGKCRFGANCKFSHDINTATTSQGFSGGFNGSTSSDFGMIVIDHGKSKVLQKMKNLNCQVVSF
jgi:hypothetical protein